jgi:transcriptional regulator with XRE-family HTH domain
MLVQDLNIIKTRRKELKITQPHLAELAGISTNTLYKLERGQKSFFRGSQ